YLQSKGNRHSSGVLRLARAVRCHCLDCAGGSQGEVDHCAVGPQCALFPWRFGRFDGPSAEDFLNYYKTKNSK
ncbi:hypothetical protein ACFLRC_04455, partial [Candidatus Altiarchaeota archaeon]